MYAVADIIKNLSTYENNIKVPESRTANAVKQIDLLHCKDDGWITIASIEEDKYFQWHYKTKELKDNIFKVIGAESSNVYLSPNSFFKPERRVENLRRINALYIDLDYYKIDEFKELKPWQIIELLRLDYFNASIPEPSFIVDTGRGIALYWLIEPVPDRALPLWNALQRQFCENLSSIGADPKSIDGARIMRLSGSINQKSGKVSKLNVPYENVMIYKINQLQAEYLPELTPYVKKDNKKRSKSRVVNLYNAHTLHHARLLDLVKLMEIRKGYCRSLDGKLTVSGQREFMCFMYRYWSCCYSGDNEKSLEDTLSFNDKFVYPLPENRVKKLTESANKAYQRWLNDGKKGYNYRNETLINTLCITDEEEKQLGTIIGKAEKGKRKLVREKKSRRNEEGLTKKQAELLIFKGKVVELKEQGLSNRKIAKILNVSEGTIRNCISKI